jgi:MauM/NapG family ferredoxin protein
MKNGLLQWIANFCSPPKEARLDLTRRQVLKAGVAGLGGGLLFHAQPSAASHAYNPALIRPPGALTEEEFLSKCIRCGECMKVCPTNVIQPASHEAGLSGMWSPVLAMGPSYCEYKCNMCTEVCPTGAIQKLALDAKQQVKIGLAHIDPGRCLPYAYGRACFACKDQCPLDNKAIWLEEATILDLHGNKVAVKLPHVNPERCIGCGACQRRCPVTGEAAIQVTSTGESRNPERQFLLDDRFSG